nr:hypothetical protein [Tanacetum cinerariifolium]
MPPGIEDDDDDSERDVPVLEELLDNYSLSLPNTESYHFDIPLPYRPPAKPPDGNTGTLNIKMMGDVFDQKVPIPNPTITRILNQEKSPDLFSHLGLEAFQPSAKCPMITNGKNIPLLDVLLLDWDRVFKIKDDFRNKQYKLKDIQELFRKLFNDVQNIHEELAEYINTLGWNRPAFCNNGDDDDVDYTIAITPVLSIEEPDNSLSMVDEHLDTIPATKSDEVIKSSVEDLVPIPSESEGIPDAMCDVHIVNHPTTLEAKDHFEIVINYNDDYSSSDDESRYNENIEYVEASPHDSEVVSLEVAEFVIPEDEEIEDDNLREKLLNVNLLIAKIEALKDNPTPSFEFLTKSSSTSFKSFLDETNTFDNSLPEFENFCFDLEKISSGSTTTHSDISLPDYEAFYFYDDHIEEISSGSTTTYFDISLSEYDSFIFDLLNDQFPPTYRSDFTYK